MKAGLSTREISRRQVPHRPSSSPSYYQNRPPRTHQLIVWRFVAPPPINGPAEYSTQWVKRLPALAVALPPTRWNKAHTTPDSAHWKLSGHERLHSDRLRAGRRAALSGHRTFQLRGAHRCHRSLWLVRSHCNAAGKGRREMIVLYRLYRFYRARGGGIKPAAIRAWNVYRNGF